MFETMATAFEEGGWGMYPIALVALVVVSIGVERVRYLFFHARVRRDDFVGTIHKYLYQGNLQRAITYCAGSRTPLARVVKGGLLRIDGSAEEIEAAMDEVALVEVPRIERRTGYLAMLSNVAVLAGLLGTISGLIKSFGSIVTVDAAEKAVTLAAGISEAMNCTAFGLGTAIPALVLYSLLSGTTQHLVDDIQTSKAQVLNLVLANRDKFRFDDVQGT